MSLTPLQHNPLQKEAQHLLLFWLYSYRYIKARLPRIYDSIYYCFITIIMHQSHCEHSLQSNIFNATRLQVHSKCDLNVLPDFAAGQIEIH